jgi:hypothetical protein
LWRPRVSPALKANDRASALATAMQGPFESRWLRTRRSYLRWFMSVTAPTVLNRSASSCCGLGARINAGQQVPGMAVARSERASERASALLAAACRITSGLRSLALPYVRRLYHTARPRRLSQGEGPGTALHTLHHGHSPTRARFPQIRTNAFK